MYTVQLSQFEGPLDALLHLVSRARIDIRDIFLSQITEQYLASLGESEDLDLDAASEFIQMASVLLEIKSRALLPRPPKLEEDEEDPEQALIRRLEEYRLYKEAGERMRTLEDEALGTLYRLPEELTTTETIELTGLTLQGLTEAFRRILKRSALAEEPAAQRRTIQRDTHSVQQCMFRIQSRLSLDMPLRFEALFDERPTRAEAVTVFVALLELWRIGVVRIEQTRAFGNIDLYKNKG